MNFSIDTIPSSYLWSALRTLEWLSQVLVSHIQLNAIVTFCCERHLRVSHVFSCLFRQLYINQCKFHIISSSHSTCTACTTKYYRFFNIWNKWLKCTYVHLSLFHSNVSNIQHLPLLGVIFRDCTPIHSLRSIHTVRLRLWFFCRNNLKVFTQCECSSLTFLNN